MADLKQINENMDKIVTELYELTEEKALELVDVLETTRKMVNLDKEDDVKLKKLIKMINETLLDEEIE
jgi:hypothetical protein